MEGEINNFILVWSTVLASLLYVHTISKFIPQGFSRLLSIIPITFLFLYLPFNLKSIHFCGLTSFFISWLANFKLLLFAFGKGPLSSNPPLPLSKFIPVSCFPIKILPEKTSKKSPLNYAVKIFLFLVLLKFYNDRKTTIHPAVKKSIYFFHIYFMLELILAVVAALSRKLAKVELESQFDEPYLATSLQDFWGKRWNLMVSRILHPTVYDPVRFLAGGVLPAKWVPMVAVLATFLVSGMMHELVFYHISRQRPTGELTLFFVMHGVCLGAEVTLKKALRGRFRLPGFVSGPMALGFVLFTAFWLFFPPYIRLKPDLKGCKETMAFLEFVKHGRLVGPHELPCPVLEYDRQIKAKELGGFSEDFLSRSQ